MAEDCNLLYYGDNLAVLRQHVADASVDLVYLDPPFNSNQTYNVLFQERDGARAASQIKAFDDTWTWDDAAESTYADIATAGGKVADCLQAFRTFLGPCDMLAYLVMMAPRLVELRRVMKPTASIYLHCDPTASHYLKMLMDAVFGPEHFRNEIVWKRSHAHSDAKQGATHFGRVTDTILFYARSDQVTWRVQYVPYAEGYLARDYRRTEPDGRRYRLSDIQGPGGAAKGNPYYEVMGVSRHWRYSREKMAELIRQGRIIQTSPGAVPQFKRYLDEMPGAPVQSLWTDIPVINNRAKEFLGYPTQKPVALLERILQASSDPGDVVLDPFCGCGTTIEAAQKLGRRWIGIDITHLAVNLIRHRLLDAFGIDPTARAVPAAPLTLPADDMAGADGSGDYATAPGRPFRVVGEPVSLPDAEALAKSDPYQFQWWALGLVGARPVEQKKGADKGIDGKLVFQGDTKGKFEAVIFSVKAGHATAAHVRDLKGVLEREQAAIGVLISLQDPTAPMKEEAVTAGYFTNAWGRYRRLQLLTVGQLLDGAAVDMPPVRQVGATFKKAKRQQTAGPEQPELDLSADQ